MRWDETDVAFAANFAKDAYGIDVVRLIMEEVERRELGKKERQLPPPQRRLLSYHEED